MINPHALQRLQFSRNGNQAHYDRESSTSSCSQEHGDQASGQRLDVANQLREKVLSLISKVANATPLTLASDNPELYGAAAKSLDSYSISLIADLPEHKLTSILKLVEFDLVLMKLLREKQRLDNSFDLCVPSSGFF